MQIDVCAILNDTTGTLMSCAWKNHNCKIGAIVGMDFAMIIQCCRIYKFRINGFKFKIKTSKHAKNIEILYLKFLIAI